MTSLQKQFQSDSSIYEIGIDEAGRGPLFGRLYVAAVVLPKNTEYEHKDIKDSKKIKSKKKMTAISEYIKQNALAYSIQYIEHSEIDEINIRQAVFKAAHRCIKEVNDLVKLKDPEAKFHILMDGNDFIPYTMYEKGTERIVSIPYDTIESGDGKLVAIASASILAKDSRDNYIAELCSQYPALIQRYALDKNMGYGTRKHLDGISEYGITQFHRRTYGRCNTARINEI
jgi:ribonuclease HII